MTTHEREKLERAARALGFAANRVAEATLLCPERMGNALRQMVVDLIHYRIRLVATDADTPNGTAAE